MLEILASVFTQLESVETIYEACSNSATIWAGPDTSIFRLARSRPELRALLCAAVKPERVLYRLLCGNGAGLN